jgi:serine/threonine protein kinase
MNSYQNKGYRLISQIGSNHWGGRKILLAEKLDTQEMVVIKQFQFATTDNNWSGFKLIEREIETLKQLRHCSIPQYLESFETENSHNIVMQYIPGTPLQESQFSLSQIHQIAIAILEVLTYLQSQSPLIVHRDLKPQNIIHGMDDQFYLIDFGLASMRSNQPSSNSSIIAGTPGFIPPEQLVHGEVNQSTDLYGLGVTLFCLLANIESEQVNQYINTNLELNINCLHGKIDTDWYLWLKSLVECDYHNRPNNAKIALNNLQKLSIQPSLQISKEKKNEWSNKYDVYLFMSSLLVYFIAIKLPPIAIAIDKLSFFVDNIFSIHINPNNFDLREALTRVTEMIIFLIRTSVISIMIPPIILVCVSQQGLSETFQGIPATIQDLLKIFLTEYGNNKGLKSIDIRNTPEKKLLISLRQSEITDKQIKAESIKLSNFEIEKLKNYLETQIAEYEKCKVFMSKILYPVLPISTVALLLLMFLDSSKVLVAPLIIAG